MRRTRASNNVASLPAMSDSETPGYYADRDGITPGTTLTADDRNMIQEELCAVVTDAGLTLDSTGATRDQVSQAIQLRVAALKSSATAAVGTTTHLRAVLASTSGDAEGANSAVVASDTGYANAANAAVVASDHGSTAGAQTAIIASEQVTALKNQIAAASSNAALLASVDCNVTNGDQAAVIASDTCDVADGVTEAFIAASSDSAPQTSGSKVAIVASANAIMAASSVSAIIASASIPNVANAGASAVIACGANGDPGEIDSAASCLVAASDRALISGAAIDSAVVACAGQTIITAGGTSVSASEQSAAVASYGAELEGTSRCLVAASYNSSIKENLAQSAIIGCVESTMPITSMTAQVGAVMLASSYCDGGQNQGTADPPNFSVFGGYHASSLSPNTWRVESNGGYMRSLNAHATGGLDYAEMRPNGDGAAHPPARLLARRGGRAVKLAKAGDPIHSIVSVNPTVLGGDDGLGWQGRYLRDEWGALVIETVEMVRWRAYDGPAAGAPPAPGQAEGFGKVLGKVAQARIRWAAYDGPEALATGDSRVPGAERYVDTSEGLEIQCIRWPAGDSLLAADGPDYPGDAKPYTVMVPAEPTPWLRWAAYDGALVNAPCTPPEDAERYQVRQPALNPDYDPRRPQVPRSERPAEYTKCGLLGELRLQVDETVKVDDEIVPLKDGVGTAGVYCGRGKHVECSAIAEPFDAEKGYAVAIVEIY